ncbi:MAG: ATP-binding protein [Alphaproteobacteria bacterium]
MHAANDPQAPRPGRFGTLAGAILRRPPVLAFALLIAVGLAVPLLLLHVSAGMNEAARSGSLALARTATGALSNADSQTAIDYARWDEARERLIGAVDLAWADNYIGQVLGENFQLSGSLVIGEAGDIKYLWADHPTLQATPPATLLKEVMALNLKASADPAGETWQGYLTLDGAVFLASAARVQGETPGLGLNGPVLVLFRTLDRALLARIEADYVLRELRVVGDEAAVHPDEVSLALGDVNGEPTITIAWRLDWPGDRMIWSFGLPVALVLACLLALTMYCLSRMHRYARQVAATNVALSAREAEAQAARLRAEAADRAKTNFLANMSHELRTPLNAVIGFCDLLESEAHGPINQQQAGFLGDIRSGGNHLLAIIGDVLDMAQLGAGHYRIAPQPIVLAGLVDECLRLAAPRANEGGIRLSNAIDRSLPAVHADARSIRQVLINLIGNAVKFTPRGGEVQVSGRLERDGSCLVTVADNGIGIPPDTLARLFQPFQQGDDTLSRRHEGTGLGLSISRALMALHGGTLDIESELGKGTRVLARFPAERVIRDAGDAAEPTEAIRQSA